MRSSTQPMCPAELRTRYQSSITGFGGSGGLPGAVAGAGLEEGAVAAALAGAADGVFG